MMEQRSRKIRKEVKVIQPKIIMANAFPQSGVTWLIHLLCWLFEAEQGGVELRKNLKWLEGTNKIYEVHKGHYKGYEVPEYVDWMVLSIKNPLDVIVSKWFYNGGVSDIQGAVDVVCKDWDGWYQTWLDYSGEKNLILTKYENLINYPKVELTNIFQAVTLEKPCASHLEKVVNENSIEKLRKRTGDKKRKFFRKGIIGDHKHFLSEAQIEQVKNELGDMMEVFGYDNISS